MGSSVRGRQVEAGVYVIDDDAAMRDSLRALFEVRGLETACFDSAEAFRARHDRSTRGCLIVDLNLRASSGLDVLQALTRDGYRLPTVLLTGRGGDTVRAKAMAAGAVACLDKPFEPDHLVATVRRALADAVADR